MIHFKREGEHVKLGLNLYRAPGGFVAVWVWFDFATCEAFSARFRLRLHLSPRILWTVERVNVIDGHLLSHDLELVSRKVLRDLKSIVRHQMRANEQMAYIKPKSQG
jgi:hypothetical protein